MKKRSLKVRLLAINVVAIAVILATTGLGLVFLFERHLERRVGAELDTYINQIAANLTFDDSGLPELTDELADPRFEHVFSGLYWQVSIEGTDKLIRSRSLWDTRIELPQGTSPIGHVNVHNAFGPENSSLLVHERRLVFDLGSREKVARLVTAVDRTDVEAETATFAWEVSLALSALAAVLICSAWLQVVVGLKPLTVIQSAVGAIRDGSAARIDVDVPMEVTPLVDEVNEMLTAQETMLIKARQRSADLAHGFKTPLTALKTDVSRLRSKGEEKIAADIETTSLLMQRQIDRELATARVHNAKKAATTRIDKVVQGLIRTLERTPQAEAKSITAELEVYATVKMDEDDLSEVLGNLLENAIKFAKENVTIQTVKIGSLIQVNIEDDGPGVSKELRYSIVQRGTRLDQSHVGSGLGLAIVHDVLEHYGTKLTLGASNLGGLKISFQLPLIDDV